MQASKAAQGTKTLVTNAYVVLPFLVLLAACTPTPGSVAPKISGEQTGPAIKNMDVEIKPQSDGRMEVLTAITYDPQRITRAEVLSTTPKLCADYGKLRVANVQDGTPTKSGDEVLQVQCL